MKIRFLLISLLLVSSCFGGEEQKLLDAIECDRREIVGNLQLVVDTEAKDREHYKPLSAEVIPIRMRQAAKGYHGPTRGSYILIIEHYASEKAAEQRAGEYKGDYSKRIAKPTVEEREGKSSVRCWAVVDGKRVYLLTSHAVVYSALEELKHGIRDKLRGYLKGRGGEE